MKSRVKKSQVYSIDKIVCSSLSMSENRVSTHMKYCGIVQLYLATEGVSSVA